MIILCACSYLGSARVIIMGGEVPRFVAGRRRRMAHDHHVLQFVPAARGRSGHPLHMMIMFGRSYLALRGVIIMACSLYLKAAGMMIRGGEVLGVVPGRCGKEST